MIAGRRTVLGIVGAGLVGILVQAASAAPWDKLLSMNRVDADPSKAYALEKSNGPWMILACPFSGPKADEQAHDLILELRKRYKLPAYQYKRKFDVGEVAGLGVDRFGNPRRMRVRGKTEFEETVVLVGDYKSAEDSEAQETLERLKYCQPDCLKLANGKETARSLAGWRAIQSYVLPEDNAKKHKGPMGHAMITTNPLLSAEHFVPNQIDDVVLKANEGVEHCLLDCRGKFTVQVARFTGKAQVIVDKKTAQKAATLLSDPSQSLLVRAAESAHDMVVALRKRGVDAYEFHDVDASIVTIGSFQSQGTPGPDGEMVYEPQIRAVMAKFQARPSATGEMQLLSLGEVLQDKSLPKVQADLRFLAQPNVMAVPKRSVSAFLRRETASR
jgi:hypothetical protein